MSGSVHGGPGRARGATTPGRTRPTSGEAFGVGLVRASLTSLSLIPLLTACVPTRGGWEDEAFVSARPALHGLDGQRLGDMVPFPAVLPPTTSTAAPAVALVACRFAPGSVLRVHAGGPGWSEAIGERALAAFSGLARREGLGVIRTPTAPAEIEIQAVEGESADAPEGLGDTLVECDVGPASEALEASEAPGEPTPLHRGRILRAEVRMRRSGLDAAGRLRRSSDEAWVGALLHELGHALGFSGHVAAGHSLLVRDESRLKKIGRAVLRGEPIEDPTLAALHRLSPGERLGTRCFSTASAERVRALLDLDAARRAAGNRRTATLASVGDLEARVVFRYADGSRLTLRLPAWPQRLRSGGQLIAVVDRTALSP